MESKRDTIMESKWVCRCLPKHSGSGGTPQKKKETKLVCYPKSHFGSFFVVCVRQPTEIVEGQPNAFATVRLKRLKRHPTNSVRMAAQRTAQRISNCVR
jgi:hypothetical protein